MNTTILPRRATAKKWKEVNPIIRKKEFIVVETRFGFKYKLGDGKTAYKLLPFVSLFDGLQNGFIYTQDSEVPSVRIRFMSENEEVLEFKSDLDK